MEVQVCRQVKKNCWNLYDSHGEICVVCGCCSNDKRLRYTSRIECLNERIAETKLFDMWDEDPKFRKIQESNINKDIQYWQTQIKYYEQCLKKLDTAEEE